MKSRILVVDDNPKNIQVLATHLKNDDYEVEYASNGKEAVNLIQKEDFDLILLDVIMPGIDGFETCRRIKKLENKKHIPIIFVTAKTDIDSLTLGFEYGGVDYISKPFKADELLLRVSTHVDLKKARDLLNYHKTYLEKRELFYNDKINKQHKEFVEKEKMLASKIDAQSEAIKLFTDMHNNSLNTLSTPVSLLKLEDLNEKASGLIKTISDALKSNSKTAEFLLKNEIYFVKPKEAIDKVNVSLDRLIGDSIGTFSSKIRAKSIQLDTNLVSGKEILADKNLMQTCIDEVLKNAITFTPENGIIRIDLAEKNGALELKISDSGIGFTKNQLLYPFKPEKKEDSSEIGLNLFFTNYIFQLHQFNLKLGNNSDSGANVLMTFLTS